MIKAMKDFQVPMRVEVEENTARATRTLGYRCRAHWQHDPNATVADVW